MEVNIVNNFTFNLSFLEFIIPPLCASFLCAGILLFIYLFIKYRTIMNFSLILLGLCGFVFAGSETMILGITIWDYPQIYGRYFHRIEQLGAVFCFFALPLYLSQSLKVNKLWRKINIAVAVFGLMFSLIVVFVSFVWPDYYISLNHPATGWDTIQVNYARGREGSLYFIRDIILYFIMLYTILSFIADYVINKNIKNILVPFIGVIFAVIGGIDDMLFVETLKHPILPHLIFSRFCLGFTIWVFLSMTHEIARFINSVKDLAVANVIIKKSEEKYKMLIESSTDFIFILNPDLTFKVANHSMLKNLRIKEDSLDNKKFYDMIILDNEGGQQFSKNIIDEKISNLLEKKEPFHTIIKFPVGIDREIKEYFLKMNLIEINNDIELIGQASPLKKDSLLEYFDSEEQKYFISNYLSTSEDISNRMVRNLSKYLKKEDLNIFRIGLREMIINAIEHGNLNISFDEKSVLLKNGNYFEFIKNRQNDENFRNKKVMIHYKINSKKAVYTIADEGNGFDYLKIMDEVKNPEKLEFLAHGRGILMALSVFDEVVYNDTGNQVTLVKNLCK